MNNQNEITNNNLLSEFKNAKRRNKLSLEESNAIYKRLMKTKDKSMSKIARVKKMYKRKEFEECTYQPKINRSSSKLVVKKNRKNLSNRINDILEEREKKRQKIRKEKDINKERDIIENCTFTPKINRKRSRVFKSRRNSCTSNRNEELSVSKLEVNQELREKNLKKMMRKVSRKHETGIVDGRSRSRNNLTPVRKRQMSFGNLKRNQSKGRSRKRTRGAKTPTRAMMKARKGSRKGRKRPVDPDIFSKRSIVILNEDDEFEDLNVYLNKKRQKLEESQKIFSEFEEILSKKISQEKRQGSVNPSPEKQDNLEQEEEERHKKEQDILLQNLKEATFSGLEFKPHQEQHPRTAKPKPKRVRKRRRSYQRSAKNSKKSEKIRNKENEPSLNTESAGLSILQFKGSDANNLEESFPDLSSMKLTPAPETPLDNSSMGDKEYLVINGEKIYFNKNTIHSIIDTKRIKKLSNCFNEYT